MIPFVPAWSNAPLLIWFSLFNCLFLKGPPKNENPGEHEWYAENLPHIYCHGGFKINLRFLQKFKQKPEPEANN
jgi:hypothetical protein